MLIDFDTSSGQQTFQIAAHPGEEERLLLSEKPDKIDSDAATRGVDLFFALNWYEQTPLGVNSLCKAKPILEWTLVLMFQTRSCLSPCF